MKVLLPILLATGISHASESRIKIAVVDTGIHKQQVLLPYMCKSGVRNMTEFDESDVNGHGSHIVHIIGTRIDVKKYCIVSYKVWHNSQKGVMSNTLKALEDIADNDFKYVNVSMSGGDFNIKEYLLFKRLTNSEVKVSVAAGNNKITFTDRSCSIYPACYKLNHNFYVVSAKDTPASNKGKFTIKEKGRNISSYGGIMSGSSQATAIWTSKLTKSNK